MVVVADHHPLSRIGVCHALTVHGFDVIEAADAEEAVAAAFRHRPRVCLLCVDLPGDGIAAANRISSQLPDTKIAMLTANGN
jgi:DNA-binding NarL/FixJ family response regulator